MTTSWRKEWFDYVRMIRKRESRKSKQACDHKKAMNLASLTWGDYKLKLKKKYERARKKADKKTTSSELVPLKTDQGTTLDC